MVFLPDQRTASRGDLGDRCGDIRIILVLARAFLVGKINAVLDYRTFSFLSALAGQGLSILTAHRPSPGYPGRKDVRKIGGQSSNQVVGRHDS